MNKEKKTKASIDNIYTLNGKVPLGHAVPFGLQHILAMFVANIAPIIIVANMLQIRNTYLFVRFIWQSNVLVIRIFDISSVTCKTGYITGLTKYADLIIQMISTIVWCVL